MTVSGFPLLMAFGQGRSQVIALPQPTEKPATFAFEQLRDGIRQYYREIKAIEVEYEQTTDVVSAEPGDEHVIPRAMHRFASRGEKRLCCGSYPPRGKAGATLELGSTHAFNGDYYQVYTPAEKTGFIARSKDPFVDSDAYMRALAIPVSDRDGSFVSRTEYFFPYVLDHADFEWKVSPKLEIVDGAECHVLESKFRQRIRVDPRIGYAMRFRERYWPVKDRPANQLPLGVRNLFSSYRQLADGIRLPQRIDSVQYTSPSLPENLWNRVRFVVVRQAAKLAINEQVEDSLFTLSFPSGTVVTDTIRNRAYRIGSANEELDVIVEKG